MHGVSSLPVAKGVKGLVPLVFLLAVVFRQRLANPDFLPPSVSRDDFSFSCWSVNKNKLACTFLFLNFSFTVTALFPFEFCFSNNVCLYGVDVRLNNLSLCLFWPYSVLVGAAGTSDILWRLISAKATSFSPSVFPCRIYSIAHIYWQADRLSAEHLLLIYQKIFHLWSWCH